MKITVILLLVTLSAFALVQAVPVLIQVPPLPNTPPTYTDSTVIKSDRRSTAASIIAREQTGASQLPNSRIPAQSSVDVVKLHVQEKPENTTPRILARRWHPWAKIKSAFHHIGHSISHVGHVVKHAAHFIAKHGSVIAKVGLKVAATLGEVAGKAAPFIPGMGSVAGKALVEGSKKLNVASDAIHVHVGGKLGAAMRGMDTAQRIAGKIP